MRHRTLMLAAVVLSMVVESSAFAATRSPRAYAPYSPEPVSSWNGFYVGVNAGYGWASTSVTGASVSSDLNGFVGGGQLGYNFQLGSSFIVGIEADFQGSNQSRSDTALGITVEQKLPWFATVRGRIGYVFNNFMLYGTGGVAWINYKLSASSLGVTVSDDATKAAFAVGGGVEWMFMPRWSAKLEYLYIDTGTTSVTLFGTAISGRAKDNIARLGLNYHF